MKKLKHYILATLFLTFFSSCKCKNIFREAIDTIKSVGTSFKKSLRNLAQERAEKYGKDFKLPEIESDKLRILILSNAKQRIDQRIKQNTEQKISEEEYNEMLNIEIHKIANEMINKYPPKKQGAILKIIMTAFNN